MRHRTGHLLSLMLTPLGAAVATISFFLPWVKFTCLGTKKSLSGAELGGAFWVIPIAAVVAAAVCVFCLLRGRTRLSRLAIALSVLAALVAILIKYLTLVGDLQGELAVRVARDVGFRVQPGAVATVLGLVLILAGVPFLRRTGRPAPPTTGEGERTNARCALQKGAPQ